MTNVIYYIFVTLGTTIFCLCALFLLKAPFFKLSTSSVKQLDIIFNPLLKEIEKDRLILKNLFYVLLYFFSFIFLLFISIVIGTLPILLINLINVEFVIDTHSIYFYLSMFLGGLPILFFGKTLNKSDYSYWSRLLHTIILDNYNIGKYLFRRSIKKQYIEETSSEFIIITGLARGGTTALTNLLYESDIFHSINYSNMPFLLAPRFWKKIYNPKSQRERERAHGDKVFFSENSIEALEEYFFKAFLDDGYIYDNYLSKHEISIELYNKYLLYQEQFKKNPKQTTVYLSKNNNFMLRYESIRKINQQFSVFLIFRNPVEHANSLFSQHLNFTQKQNEDIFILEYMNWLGHYEFGLNHKYFRFSKDFRQNDYHKNSINYWLLIWINYYSYILQLDEDDRLYLVDYNDLALHPNELKSKIFLCLGKKLSYQSIEPFKMKSYNINAQIDNKLISIANSIYEELIQNKVKI